LKEGHLSTTWIFQWNPDLFDIDGYLAQCPTLHCTIGQRHCAPDMRVGDTVFFWRAAGRRKALSGIIARGAMVDVPSLRKQDEPSKPFELKGRTGNSLRLRVKVAIDLRAAPGRAFLRAEDLKAHRLLKGLGVLTQPHATNYAVSPKMEVELARLLKRAIRMGEGTPGLPTEVIREFGEAPNDDLTKLQTYARRIRRGQVKFRAKLLHLYGNKCAISGWAPARVLDAAHISRHADTGLNHSSNGLLLRTDLHVLFDEGLLRINPTTMKVELDKALRATEYWSFNGTKLRLRHDRSQPSRKHLKSRWNSKSA
jgi:hypothetical protein